MTKVGDRIRALYKEGGVRRRSGDIECEVVATSTDGAQVCVRYDSGEIEVFNLGDEEVKKGGSWVPSGRKTLTSDTVPGVYVIEG